MPFLQQPLALAALSAGLGVVSHLTYFIHGEHHNSSPTLAVLTFTIPSLLFSGQLLYMNAGLGQAATTTTLMTSSFFTALWTSMILYRLFFHRLNKFPGPFMAKVSKLYHMSLLGKSDNYLILDRWHQKYGDFVRTGKSIEGSITEVIVDEHSKVLMKLPSLRQRDP